MKFHQHISAIVAFSSLHCSTQWHDEISVLSACAHLPMKTSGLSIKDRIMSERDVRVKPQQSSGGGSGDEQAEHCSWRWEGFAFRHSDREAAAVGEVQSAALWMNIV